MFHIRFKTQQYFLFAATLSVVVVVSFFLLGTGTTENTQITKSKISGDKATGLVIKGSNTSEKKNHAMTSSTLVYESKILVSPKPEANAAILHWEQEDNPGEAMAAFRIFDGKEWTKWIESSTDADRKDGTSAPHAALVVASQIHKIQYRFEITADMTQAISPEIDLASTSVELVDTSKGPSPTKSIGFIDNILKNFGLFSRANAQSGPHIYTRAEWGSPEPDSSDRWTPEYQALDRVIVHHTAVVASADSAAAVRAIWYYHANSLGWGDIGYNYLVDGSGNIFQGRYFDHDYAAQNRMDVVGGHALSYNYGSSGIAALGDFTNSQPSGAMLNSISSVAAFKLSRYGVEPSGFSTGGLPAIIGHRDVNQTSCPANIHQHLSTIRSLATSEYNRYPPYEWSLKSFGIYSDPARTLPFSSHTTVAPGGKVYVRIVATNSGTQTWDRSFLRLGTAKPYQRTSQFYDASWYNTTRPAQMSEQSVPPGASGTFDFTLNAPQVTGSYQEHFNLVAENRTWLNETGSSIIVNVVSPVAASNSYYTSLASGEVLQPGEYLLSPDGQSVFILQGDGNLVLYSNFKAIWNSGTAGKPANRLEMQTDGNLVLHFKDGSNWSTSTFSHAGAHLKLQTDGRAVIYDAGNVEIWSAGTIHLPDHLSYVNTSLSGVLFARQQLETADRRYRLALQADGNLVLYSTNRALWSSGTFGQPSKYLYMQPDGNLVIYRENGTAAWNTMTNGRGASQLRIQQDGNLVIYGPGERSTWSSGTFGQF